MISVLKKYYIGFVSGFTIVFVLMGAFAGSIGKLMRDHTVVLNLVTGLIVIVFGLNFPGILKIGFLNRTSRKSADVKSLGFFSSML